MPYRENNNQTLVLILICFSVLALGLSVIFNIQVINRRIGETNQAYNQVEPCIVSVSPTVRTSEYVRDCYTNVEKQFNQNLNHYGNDK